MEIIRQKKFEESTENFNLSISLNGYVVTDDSWKQKELHSPWSRVYYVIDGKGVFLHNGNEIPIEAGYVYLAPCGIPYGFRGITPITKLFFHINVIKPDGYDLFATPDSRIIRFERDRGEMEQLALWYLSDDPIKHMRLKSELLKTVSDAAAAITDPKLRPSVYSDTVASAIAYIRGHLSASLKATEVSAAVFCSAASLNERFVKELGITVAKYIDDLLMFEARKMLASESMTIGEISAILGYCDQFYFSRRFTKCFSISPREYKKSRSES